MYGTFSGYFFSIKAFIKSKPFSSLSTVFISSVLLCAYVLRVFERPLSEVSGQNFDVYWSSIWNVIVTMSTVGYGDIYPKSFGGRILGTVMSVWGIFLTALFVVTL